MTQTLARERKAKFSAILAKHLYNVPMLPQEAEELVNELVEASLSRTERKQEEPQDKVMASLFRGEYRDYPEHLWKIAECLRDVWMFRLPDKPNKTNKKDKSQYALYINAMEQIQISCAEFGIKPLVETHTKWRAAFKDGIAPYTVAQPTSLINVVAATAREMRELIGTSSNPRPETKKFEPEPEDKFVPMPGRK